MNWKKIWKKKNGKIRLDKVLSQVSLNQNETSDLWYVKWNTLFRYVCSWRKGCLPAVWGSFEYTSNFSFSFDKTKDKRQYVNTSIQGISAATHCGWTIISLTFHHWPYFNSTVILSSWRDGIHDENFTGVIWPKYEMFVVVVPGCLM